MPALKKKRALSQTTPTKENKNNGSVTVDADGKVLKKKRIRKKQNVSQTRPVTIPKKTASVDPALLRPISIDGNNVARNHGISTSTYSVKGIQLSVNYFLDRGHTRVYAFVPKYRQYATNAAVPTTDVAILKEMEKKGHVVFVETQRNLDGKNVIYYDDRVIVRFAAEEGGVIISNDRFRDLKGESEAFKEAILKRSLPFLFAGDKFMVIDQPFGKDGPKLDEFLSFPLQKN